MPLRQEVWARLGGELKAPHLASMVSRVAQLAEVLDAAPLLMERRALGRILVQCAPPQ
jgi:NADPH:quinone reductase-like Zn-dependent oxidoreductase